MLPLYPSRSIPSGQLLNFVYGNPVKVTLNGMLKSRSSYRKFDGILCIVTVDQGIDKTAAKAVASAYPVYYP